MKILFAAAEVAPFIKTGGLADVAGSLPVALANEGHEVKVILPLYESIGVQWRDQMSLQCCFELTLAWRKIYCGIYSLEQNGVTYLFVDNEYYFKRFQIYGHFDDCERFSYFSRAVIEVSTHLEWFPDIIHCNDWQTALVPVYLLEDRYRIPNLAGTKSVFSIHNIEYQGRYSASVLEDVIGLTRSYYNEGMMAFHGDINLMKGAILSANFVTTVSPSYADELRYPFYAHGLSGVVQEQQWKMLGILNGIDMDLYNPATASTLASPFNTRTLIKGKNICKLALQQTLGLKEDNNIPIIACVSRLASHKGFSLVTEVIDDIMKVRVQMVVLGTGEAEYENAFRQAAEKYPERFSCQLAYSAPLSTAIYAGADIFLMPSISEPCGLSQMIAMRYGTLPIVRETGGLRDSVIPYNELDGSGNGFTFSNVNAHDMLHVIEDAVTLYHRNKKSWRILQKNAMTTDFSWDRSAKEYLDIYEDLIK